MQSIFKLASTALLISSLFACGGGGGSTDSSSEESSNYSLASTSPTSALASQFLSRATFGATSSEVSSLTTSNMNAWIDAQATIPQTLHVPNLDAAIAALPAMQTPSTNMDYDSFYKNTLTGTDQLRQRVGFALSEIMVISMVDAGVASSPRGIASYMDTLNKNALGNFRDLLQDVTLHPMMGIYLTSIKNQKADASGRKPDENYAREVMQLFAIGLYQLNNDGTNKLGSDGQPIETYTNDDVTGLAKVFTGYSYSGPDKTDGRFYGNTIPAKNPNWEITPMQSYPKFYSLEEKDFLGTVVPAGTAPDVNLKIALDALFNHPNVGPFISKQLIQRLVTSNPSPQYVARVASVFNNNGSGVRGDLKAVVRAILTEDEALSPTNSTTRGKVREPVLRLTNFIRTFNSKSTTGQYTIGNTSDFNASLGQAPLTAGSVFNFYRPGYIPPNSEIANQNLVAPEFQITHEASVVGYMNYMRSIITSGAGAGNPREIQPDFTEQLVLSDTPVTLVDNLDLLLTGSSTPGAIKQQISDSVATIAIPTTNAVNIANAKRNRINLGIYLIMSSPSYIIEK